jgi:hypothetical protein
MKSTICFLVLAGVAGLATGRDIVVSYEPEEANLVVSSGEIQTVEKTLGGVNDVPFATDGLYVLKLAWTGQTDRKVDVYHDGLNYNLSDYDKMLVDVYIPEGSALFSTNGIIGIFSDNWIPGNWACGDIVPDETGKWFTVEMDISSFASGVLDHISELIFEDYAADDGTVYVDNIRLVNDIPDSVVAVGHDKRIDIDWQPVESYAVEGYNIFRAGSASGPWSKINSSTHPYTFYSDFTGTNGQTFYYCVVTVKGTGTSDASQVVSGSTYAMTDTELLESVQQTLWRYFWEGAHSESGLARDSSHAPDACVTGGTGFGIMNIIIASEKGYVDRLKAAKRILDIMTFLDEKTTRYHGVWAHSVNGITGETIPFAGDQDNGGDLVETALLIQGMLTARQYFDSSNPVETAIRNKATELWEQVEWDWYRRYPDGDVLYWHWSPDYEWALDHRIRGFNETMIVYLLAIASPTHSVPASLYHTGWAGPSEYRNDGSYWGYRRWVGSYGMCLFFTHYSFLGFDPRDKTDTYCNYFENSRNITLTHRAYCTSNPNGFDDYSNLVWGLTASEDPLLGYDAHSPTSDNGTIAPTACISSMPFAPAESTAALRHLYDTYGNNLWGNFGFKDAFNPTEDWYSNNYISIDQGPMSIMIENYLSGLCWDNFMANPEIAPMLEDIGWTTGKLASTELTESSQGLNYEYYMGVWSNLPDFDSLSAYHTGTVNNLVLTPRTQDDYFGFRFTGYIEVPEDGTYYFYLASDDGSQLFIDNKLIVDNDGLHSAGEDVRGAIGLQAGKHLIEVRYFERTGSHILNISYEGPGMSKQSIPDSILFRCDLSGDITGDCSVDIYDIKLLSENWLSDYTFIDFSEMTINWMK